MDERNKIAASRLIDASANRMTEALRVIEDYARYALNDRFLVTALKTMRHEVVGAVQIAADPHVRTAARDTMGDVGTDVTTPSEADREGLRALAAANFARAQQAARSLEECMKTVLPNHENRSPQETLEQIRYRLYTLEKAVMTNARSREALASVMIYAIIDCGESLELYESHIDRLLAAGVDAIQLREKRVPDQALLRCSQILTAKTSSLDTLAIVNDRPDLAVLSRADGVHLGQDDLDVSAARRIVGTDMLVGVSTHSLSQARQSVLAGADYLGVGPMFASTTKTSDALAGPSVLEQVNNEISLPTFAIGGIRMGNVDQIAAAGGTRIAVSEALGPQVPDLVTAINKLRSALRQMERQPSGC